eukprot:243710-Pleurochrysis_carterae.AAC.1
MAVEPLEKLMTESMTVQYTVQRPLLSRFAVQLKHERIKAVGTSSGNDSVRFKRDARCAASGAWPPARSGAVTNQRISHATSADEHYVTQ